MEKDIGARQKMKTAEVVYLETTEEYVGIKIDRTKDQFLSEHASKLLKDYYQTKQEVSPEDLQLCKFRLVYVCVTTSIQCSYAR